MGVISLIGCFKSPIRDTVSNWGLGIYSLSLFYLTQKSPSPNRLYSFKLGIGYTQLGILCPIGIFSVSSLIGSTTNHANGIKSNKKTHAMVFRVTNKLMLWYLEHQINSIYSNKEIHAEGNNNKAIHAPVSRTNILETWDLSKIFRPPTPPQKKIL